MKIYYSGFAVRTTWHPVDILYSSYLATNRNGVTLDLDDYLKLRSNLHHSSGLWWLLQENQTWQKHYCMIAWMRFYSIDWWLWLWPLVKMSHKLPVQPMCVCALSLSVSHHVNSWVILMRFHGWCEIFRSINYHPIDSNRTMKRFLWAFIELKILFPLPAKEKN